MKQVKKQKRVQPVSKKKEEGLSYSVKVRDKEGRVLQRISAPSRSYVQQWNQLLNVQAAQANKTVKDTEGIAQSAEAQAANFSLQSAGIGEIRWGIRVGKGTTAVAITDFALGSPLGEGTDTDEFNHQAVTFTVPSVVGSTCSFTIKRVMINNSGATISDIKEIGCYHFYKPGNWAALGFRDVLPSAVYVPHGGSITVTYTFRVTV